MYKKYIYIYINFQKQKKIIQKYGDCAFCNLAFYNVAYNIFKIKSYIFKIFYIIINKYINNYYFKEIIRFFFQLNILLNNYFKRNNNIFY